MRLSEDLRKWRSERPDEWTMDRFINEATRLEAEVEKFTSTNSAMDAIALLDEYRRILMWADKGDYFRDLLAKWFVKLHLYLEQQHQ